MLTKFEKNSMMLIMLCEIKNVKQYDGEPQRRWFVDDYFDLIVWLSKSNEVIGFQLCYDKMKNQHALTWHKNSGYIHNRVDDGEHKPGKYKATPVLVTDGTFEAEAVAEIFKWESRNMDKELAQFISQMLKEYSDWHSAETDSEL
jgi:hypothetical protein